MKGIRWMIKPEDSIAVTNPDIASEWNFEKNRGSTNKKGEDISTPDKVTRNSGQKVWWLCKLGHEWVSSINNRCGTNTNGCPYCSGRLAILGKTDLGTTHPDLVKEWDYEKNAPLTPEMVTAGSERKAWWTGSCGHSWQATIGNRAKTNGTHCPYCAGKTVLKGFNDLYTVNPRLAEEWNYEKNKTLKTKRGDDISTPDKVVHSSNYKVWWKCRFGHEWQDTINHRDRNRNCPYCTGSQTSMPEQGIAFYLAQICNIEQRIKIDGKEIDVYLPEYMIGIEYDGKYYHKNKEKDDRKKTVFFESLGIKIIRIIESNDNRCSDNYIYFKEDAMGANYEWALQTMANLLYLYTNNNSFGSLDISIKRDNTLIRERFDYTEKDRSLQKLYPDIASEWNSERNGNLKPDMFAGSSNQVVWWRCSLGHEWKSTINNRTGAHQNGCPYCSNKKVLSGFNDLATTNPMLASEWNYEKNGDLHPSEVLPKTNKTVWWKCSNRHEWKASINARAYGIGCPYCSGRYAISGENDLQTRFPAIAAEWNYEKNGDLDPTNVTAYSHIKVWWKCSVGHEWESMISNRTGTNQNGCPYCSGKIPKKVKCIETDKVYSSIAEAKKETGACKISECCLGKRKTAGGFHWKYVEEQCFIFLSRKE